jgi:hypothetical protein
MYTFTNPYRQGEEDSKNGGMYDHEESEGSDEDADEGGHNIDDDDIDIDEETEGGENDQDDGQGLLLSEGGSEPTGQDTQMDD